MIMHMGLCVGVVFAGPGFAQQALKAPIPPISAAKPLIALVPETCLSAGRSRGGSDVIMVPAAEAAAYEARGLAKVSCGNLDRRLYRDRICRAAYGGDGMQPLREYGRTVDEVRALCDAANKVLGPPATIDSSAQEGRGN